MTFPRFMILFYILVLTFLTYISFSLSVELGTGMSVFMCGFGAWWWSWIGKEWWNEE